MPEMPRPRFQFWRARFATGLVALAALGLLAAGCKVGPDFRAPATPTPDRFANASAIPQTNAPYCLRWWENFNDPFLNRLVEQASTNNYNLRHAEARLREARALWTEARFDYAPTVINQNGFTRTQISQDAAGTKDRQSNLYRTEFDATWELDLWGRVRRNVEAARATVESVAATRDDVLISVQAEVTANYLELRGLQAQLAVARRNATNQAQTLQLAIDLLNGGQGTQLDVARARSLWNETLATIPLLDAAEHRAAYRISVLCGLPPNAFGTDLLREQAPPRIPAELAISDPGDLIRHRPDVRAAEMALAADTARIGVEVSDLFPRVVLTGSVGLEASSFSGLGSAGSGAFSLGPRITWAAFNLGRVRQRIKAAGARADQALDVYQQTVLLALEETENALVALSRERERLAHLVEAERAGAEATELARQRYREGIADYLSVLDAERNLLNLQLEMVSAETIAAGRLVALYKAFAVGGAVP